MKKLRDWFINVSLGYSITMLVLLTILLFLTVK